MDAANNLGATRLHEHHYVPAAKLEHITGVQRKGLNSCGEDVYTGSKADLVAMGLAPGNLFPGAPGMPGETVVLWPAAAAYGAGRAPGRLSIKRLKSGNFTATLVLADDELARRREEASAEVRRQVELARGAGSSGRGQPAARVDQVPSGRHLRLVWSAPQA